MNELHPVKQILLLQKLFQLQIRCLRLYKVC